MNKLILRTGIKTDRESLQHLLAANDMNTDIDPSEFTVALVDGHLVGAARLEEEGNKVFLRPVVIDAKWQGNGIGRILVCYLARGLQELHVVSRGHAAGFYKSLGFSSLSWEDLPKRFRQECEDCPDADGCQPVSLVLQKKDGIIGNKTAGLNEEGCFSKIDIY